MQKAIPLALRIAPARDLDVGPHASESRTVSLFDPCLEGFFWQYDNTGLKLLQVRFYPNRS